MIPQCKIAGSVNASLSHNGCSSTDRVLNSNAAVLVAQNIENKLDQLLAQSQVNSRRWSLAGVLTQAIKEAHGVIDSVEQYLLSETRWPESTDGFRSWLEVPPVCWA
ncbi:MAG: hypothetical protein DME26_18595 [Verrucomicrobia bacterium]|nr:MAG: hypothetical protein DME26_18595 [Verrucomicrobiota bacterium]